MLKFKTLKMDVTIGCGMPDCKAELPLGLVESELECLVVGTERMQEAGWGIHGITISEGKGIIDHVCPEHLAEAQEQTKQMMKQMSDEYKIRHGITDDVEQEG
jgi:hypothetical protein